MEAHQDWNAINDASNVMELLGLVQACITQQQTRKHPVHMLMDAKAQVYSFCQKGTSDSEYYDRFKDAVQITDQLGGNFGVHSE